MSRPSVGKVKLTLANPRVPNAATLVLRVPSSVGVNMMHLVGSYFTCELTDEGILYRHAPEDEPAEVPPWLRQRKEQDDA